MIYVNELGRYYITKKGLFSKSKDIKKAVRDINFKVETGEIFGLLGSNGAGKTTTIKVLTTLLTPIKGNNSTFRKYCKI